jgi:hypothetical protein
MRLPPTAAPTDVAQETPPVGGREADKDFLESNSALAAPT